MESHRTTCHMNWRGLQIRTDYVRQLWGREMDRFHIKASEPFYKGGDDYLVRWLLTLDRSYSQEEIQALTEMWLDDALHSSSRWREGDCLRNQLTLF